MNTSIAFQTSPVAVGYAVAAARILDHVIQTGSDGLDAAVQQLNDPNRSDPEPAILGDVQV